MFYWYYPTNLFIPVKKTKTKQKTIKQNQTRSQTHVCPANSDFAASSPRPATHSSSRKIAKGLCRCCFAILTFLTWAHVPSVMLCVHHPTTHTSEANSLLATASFISWLVILISCYTASQEQRQELPPSLHEGEARSRAQHATCKPQLKRRRTRQGCIPRVVSD